MLRTTTVLVLVTALLALPACQMNERLAGTVIGASSGALVGGLASSSVVGVLVGGLAGGVTGYLVGDYIADQRERCSAPCDPCAPSPCPPACPPVASAPYAPTTSPYVTDDGCRVPLECASYGRVIAPVAGSTSAAAASRALVEKGRRAATTPEALYYYEQALQADPRNADAWNQIGLCRVSAGDRAAGRAAFERALALDPGHALARRNLDWAGGR